MTGSHRLPSTPDPTRPGLLSREPVVVTNVLGALVVEACLLLRAFGVPLTDDQQSAIVRTAALVMFIGAALLARRFTTTLADPRDNAGRLLTPNDPPNRGPRPPGASPAVE